MGTDRERFLRERFTRRLRVLIDKKGDISGLEIQENTLKKYKSAERFPQLDLLEIIKNYFNVSYDYLLGDYQDLPVVNIESIYGLSSEALNTLSEIKLDMDNKIEPIKNSAILECINILLNNKDFLLALCNRLLIEIKYKSSDKKTKKELDNYSKLCKQFTYKLEDIIESINLNEFSDTTLNSINDAESIIQDFNNIS